MRGISLFSGVGGFDLGFQKAGIETVLQAEQDKHALAVLARHWPNVERVTDVRLLQRDGCRVVDGDAADAARGGGWRTQQPDLVYGGFPCQPFSVAGKRAGTDDDRNMWPEFRRIVEELRPPWVCAENVPGLLSQDRGRYFGTIIGDLVELGYGVAWRELDAQFFGVAQRRRRIFIVAARDVGRDVGDVTAAAAVLAVRESGSGDSEASRETREGTPVAAPLGSHSTGGYRNDLDNDTYVLAQAVALRGREGGATAELGGEQANALRGSQGGGDKPYALIANALIASAGHHGHSSPRGDGSDNLIPWLADTLSVGANQTFGFVGEAVPGVIPFDTTQITSAGNYSNPRAGDPMHPLAAGAHVPAIAYALAARNAKGVSLLEGQDTFVSPGAGVRRLTPLECIRLMGFPDDWLDNGQADSHKYRQLGNAVVVPVAQWIGLRLMRVNELLSS